MAPFRMGHREFPEWATVLAGVGPVGQALWIRGGQAQLLQ